MDLLIKNLRKPIGEKKVVLILKSDGEVSIYEDKNGLIRYTDAMELPPHGRLISDTDVKTLLRSGLSLDTDADQDYVCELIDELPTIMEVSK